MAELLLELGTEELPARFVVPALSDIESTFVEACKALNLSHGSVRTFGTPRRLALWVKDVQEKTPDVNKEVQGPAVSAAFEADGVTPKLAATKFAESVKLSVAQLKRVQTPKGERLAATIEEKGKRAIELLPDVLGQCIRKIHFAKSMRWSDVEQSFGRPLQWVVALLDTEVIPVIFADVRSGRETRGHRFLSPGIISIRQPSDYESALEKAHVVADIAKRRAMLLERLEKAAHAAGGTILKDDSLVDQVVNLVELPNPVVGTFDGRHLDLPPEVLVQEMRSHQRYFSLEDKQGKLMPAFIAVSNTPVKDEKLSIKGYERVLRSRLADGRFFFDEDRRTPLASRIEKLARVTWQQKLKSSYADKVDRFRALSVFLAEKTGRGAQKAIIERGATLAKADLVTGMVGEFPELQGVMGREYAKHDKEPAEVALAIFEHYLPRGATDGLPTQDPGALIGLADRIDSLCALFAIGEKPTGAKDQYGLRRAAIAIINIILGKGYRLSLSEAVDESLKLLAPKVNEAGRKSTDAQIRQQVLEFVKDRLRPLWSESQRADIIDAVVAAGCDDLVSTHKRAQALSNVVAQGNFTPLAATVKRVGNIVDKQAKDVTPGAVDVALLSDPAEKELHTRVEAVRADVQKAIAQDDFTGALNKLVPLKAPVDTFFDKVMVNAEDKAVRQNRIRLLTQIRGLFGAIADFSAIQTEAKA